MQRHPIVVVTLLLTWIAVPGAQASDPPDSEINPQNGDIEITDAMWSGEGYNIRWVVNPGGDRQPLEEPHPIPSRTLIGTTGYDGALDVRAHARPGHLWVTWIDSADDLGYSAYDPASGTWGPVGYEPIGAGGSEAARDRVEQAVTGG
jgi:hypothetical protein